MEKITRYRKIIRQLLSDYSTIKPVNIPDIENQLLFDEENDHYQLFALGWEGTHRVLQCVFHVDLKNSKIWVQEDSTEFDLVGKMEALGVPKSDIVLAFHHPEMRPFTEYAVA